MNIKRKNFFNKLMLAMAVVGLGIAAVVLFNAMKLSDYEGSLEENLSYALPAGYEEYKANTQSSHFSDNNYKCYVRETADVRETLNIYYNGLNSHEESSFPEETTTTLGERTKVLVSRYDWDNGYDNQLNCLVVHDEETYTLEYQCQELDKEGYYSSCSDEQEAAAIEFIRTFDYHRPSNGDGGIFARLHHNLGTGGFIVFALAILIFIGLPIAYAIAGMIDSSDESKEIVRSSDLHESMNRERAAKGESSIPSINNVQGVSSNNLARRDHSWSSVPDFFIKLFRK